MTPAIHPLHRLWRHAVWMLALAGLMLPAAAGAACPPACVHLSTVAYAPGVPSGARLAINMLEFRGTAMAASADAALATLGRETRTLPPKAVLTLVVSADSALTGAAAARQAAGRAASLGKALAKAGLPAQRFRVTAF